MQSKFIPRNSIFKTSKTNLDILQGAYWKARKKGKIVWNSATQGTYRREIHGEIGNK